MVNKNAGSAEARQPGEAPKILTKPLPQILDEIEDSIKLADEAVKNARDAAEEARNAGEKAAREAAREATRAATDAIAKVEQTSEDAMQLAELIKSAIIEAASVLEKRLSGKP